MEHIHDTETPTPGAADERLAFMLRLAQSILLESCHVLLERGTIPPRDVDAAVRLVRDQIEVQINSPMAIGEFSPYLCPRTRRRARELARLLIHGHPGQTGHESHVCLCMNDSGGSAGACSCSTGAAQLDGSGEA